MRPLERSAFWSALQTRVDQLRPVVVLDLALLAVPNSAADTREAEGIIERLIGWAGCLRGSSAVLLAQLSESAETLASLNCFPTYPNIEALLKMFRLDHVYSVDAVRRAINALLERAQPLLNVLGCEVEAHSNCLTDPEILTAYDEGLRPSAERMLASVTGASLLLGRNARSLGFVALGILTTGHPSLRVRCEIERVNTSLDSSRFFCPMSSFGEVALAWSYDDLLTRLSPDDVWNNAGENRDIHLAIGLEALRILRTTNQAAQLSSVPVFAIGSGFYESLVRNSAGPNGRFADAVRETCARLVLGSPKYEVTDFMASRGGKKTKMQPLVRADGAAARRTHISKHHEALRLMFWKQPKALIELANIGPKSELQIESGVTERRIAESW